MSMLNEGNFAAPEQEAGDQPSRRGALIAFEGIDGAGKTTQARALAAWLTTNLDGLRAHYTKEPGDTHVGRVVRSAVLDPCRDLVSARRPDIGTEALLMCADRREHVVKYIRPRLQAGEWVVTDRYSGSTIAYQGYGGGLSIAHLRQLCDFAEDGVVPDVTIYLALEVVEEVEKRLQGRELDVMEGRGRSFLGKVIEGFEQQAKDDPTWIKVDATQPAGAVHLACQDIASHLNIFV